MRLSWAGFAVGLTALACGSGREVGDNRTACEAWVERVNSLGACVQVTYDPSNLCDGASELPPEMAGFYDCLRTSARCEGDEAAIGAGCTAPLVALVTTPPPSVTMDPRSGKEDR